ncbi:MAG: replication initiation protein [Streptococcaceae bacterium]|jgi:hypothetical protein|nr:replication initiation protein [Streptococcaceae bacterium]
MNQDKDIKEKQKNELVLYYHPTLQSIVFKGWTAWEIDYFHMILNLVNEHGAKPFELTHDMLLEKTTKGAYFKKNKKRWIEREITLQDKLKSIEWRNLSVATEESAMLSDDVGDRVLEDTPMFNKFKINLDKGIRTVYLNPEFLPYLDKFTLLDKEKNPKGFIPLKQDELEAFAKPTQKLLFRLLNQWRNTGERSWSVEELVEVLEMKKTYANNVTRMRKDILEPTCAVIAETVPQFKHLKVKTVWSKYGNSVWGFKFTWKKEDVVKVVTKSMTLAEMLEIKPAIIDIYDTFSAVDTLTDEDVLDLTHEVYVRFENLDEGDIELFNKQIEHTIANAEQNFKKYFLNGLDMRIKTKEQTNKLTIVPKNVDALSLRQKRKYLREQLTKELITKEQFEHSSKLLTIFQEVVLERQNGKIGQPDWLGLMKEFGIERDKEIIMRFMDQAEKLIVERGVKDSVIPFRENMDRLYHSFVALEEGMRNNQIDVATARDKYDDLATLVFAFGRSIHERTKDNNQDTP